MASKHQHCVANITKYKLLTSWCFGGASNLYIIPGIGTLSIIILSCTRPIDNLLYNLVIMCVILSLRVSEVSYEIIGVDSAI